MTRTTVLCQINSFPYSIIDLNNRTVCNNCKLNNWNHTHWFNWNKHTSAILPKTEKPSNELINLPLGITQDLREHTIYTINKISKDSINMLQFSVRTLEPTVLTTAEPSFTARGTRINLNFQHHKTSPLTYQKIRISTEHLGYQWRSCHSSKRPLAIHIHQINASTAEPMHRH